MKIFLILLLALGSACVSNADPSPSIRYLMNEPVTLFDWGILRLYDYMDEYTKHYLTTHSVRDIYSTVRYDYVHNNILISLVVTRHAPQATETPSSVKKASRDICRSITQTLRREFLTDREAHVRRSSGIYRFFGHIGFKGDQEPINAFEEIERITVISVSVYSEKDPGRLIVLSESPLMGQEIVFGGRK
jgi:hypothetical protein